MYFGNCDTGEAPEEMNKSGIWIVLVTVVMKKLALYEW